MLHSSGAAVSTSPPSPTPDLSLTSGQNFSGQVESFDDVLNEQQLVEDPTTGTYYEAPYSSYETDGPDRAGYYTSNGERLNPVAGS